MSASDRTLAVSATSHGVLQFVSNDAEETIL